MKYSFKSGYILLCRSLFIVLFMYAGLTKLLEVDLFYDNLYNSPLLPKSETLLYIMTWTIPLIEIIIAIALCFNSFNKKALISIILLLGIYSIYIAAILWIAPYQPCSCGGVVRLLSWEEHLILNALSIGLALSCLRLHLKKIRKIK